MTYEGSLWKKPDDPIKRQWKWGQVDVFVGYFKALEKAREELARQSFTTDAVSSVCNRVKHFGKPIIAKHASNRMLNSRSIHCRHLSYGQRSGTEPVRLMGTADPLCQLQDAASTTVSVSIFFQLFLISETSIADR